MDVKFENLSSFAGKKVILDNISGVIKANTVTLLCGGNGSGKSTLLKLLAGIKKPDSGTVYYNGCDIKSFSSYTRAGMCACLMQNPEAPGNISVRELASLGLYAGGKSADRNAVEIALKAVNLLDKAEQKSATLSGGERRRAFLAMTLVQSRDLILLDEPEAALDAKNKCNLLKILQQLKKSGQFTVVMAVHDLDFALETADDVIGLNGGKIEFAGKAGEVITDGNLHRLYGVPAKVIFSDRKRIIIDYR